MKGEVRNKLLTVLATTTMLISVFAVIPVSATIITKRDISIPPKPLGTNYVVVMQFNITDEGVDKLVDADGSTSYDRGSPATPLFGWEVVPFSTSDNVYADNRTDPKVVWIDNGNGQFDNTSVDTLLLNTTGSNPNGTDGTNVASWSEWKYRDGEASNNGAYDDGEDIVIDADNNSCYGDELNAVTFKNLGTADNNDITLTLWVENGTTPGFQPTEDYQLPVSGPRNATWDGDGWYLSGLSWSLDVGDSDTFYVVANISRVATAGHTIQIQIPPLLDSNSNGGYDSGDEGLFLASTDDTGNITNSYTIRIVKLGANCFEGTEEGAVDVIVTDTKDIKYGATVDIRVNTSFLTSGQTYYLYYPYYKRVGSGGSYSYYVEWKPYMIAGGAEQASIIADGTVKSFAEPIHFNVSGMWILDNDSDPTNAAEGTDTDFAYFWVNGSEVYDISLSTNKVYYGKNETITITVTEGGSAAGVWIDVRRESDNSLIFHKWAGDGVVTFNSDWMHNLTYAGNYTVFAYRDIDPTVIGYGTEGYSENYGYTDPSISASNYSAICGPWDPPEKISKVAKIVVETGKPQLEIPEINRTMYWGFNGTVKVYTKGYDGKNLTFSWRDVKVYNSEKRNVTSHVYIDANNTGYIEIWPKNGKWGTDGSPWGKNGTWRIVIADDVDSDGTEEWNGSVTFTVTKAPGVQLIITDPADKEISEVPDISSQPTTIKFQVVNRNGEYLGEGNLIEDMKNITIAGDALFIGENGKTLYEYNNTIFPGAVSYADKTWAVKLIPTMDTNGGEIKISVNWGEWGTDEETITVGGTKLNGSIVTITPSEFTIGENVTLTVKVTDANGYAYPNAYVALYYFDDTTGIIKTGYKINETNGGGTTAGEFSFLFNVTQQTDGQKDAGFSKISAPRYIVAYADITNVGCGYAYAVMKPRANLKVEVSRDAFMAGRAYDFWINVSTVDPLTGNKTGTPADSGLHVRIYNETGADVTNDVGSLTASELDGSASIELSSEYFTKPGTYTIYAYNDTHNSEGFNATIQVIPVKVTCDLNEFIWNYDRNATATFTVTWQGNPVGNGTLRIYNITSKGTYNSTWANNTHIDITLVNGIAIMHNITAEYLPNNTGRMNITFEYKPEAGGSEFAKADGVVPVKVPDATPTPDKVAIGETATVNVLVTGRGQPLSGVNVTLKGAGINLNATTGSDGIATFSFLPGSTGKISILIENRSTGVTIEVTAYALEIEIPASVAEGTFTITVKDEKGNPVEGAYVKFTGTGETKTTNSEGKVTFNITIPGTMPYATYKLIATKAGYRSDEETITIANVFNLYITAPSKLSAGQKLTVKVTSDTGPVYGVTVTIKKGEEVIDTKTLTGPEGVTFTIPKVKEKTTFTIIAEKEGFNPATYEITVSPAGIPGFELITLLAAIGIAIILLRKKKQ